MPSTLNKSLASKYAKSRVAVAFEVPVILAHEAGCPVFVNADLIAAELPPWSDKP